MLDCSCRSWCVCDCACLGLVNEREEVGVKVNPTDCSRFSGGVTRKDLKYSNSFSSEGGRAGLFPADADVERVPAAMVLDATLLEKGVICEVVSVVFSFSRKVLLTLLG